jgi:hypothetical protein
MIQVYICDRLVCEFSAEEWECLIPDEVFYGEESSAAAIKHHLVSGVAAMFSHNPSLLTKPQSTDAIP